MSAFEFSSSDEDFSSRNDTSVATDQEQIVIATVIAVLGIWSTVGNIITILAITLHRGMLTKCNLFILSLAVSDLFSGLIASPLWLYRRTWGFNQWEWGTFLCKLFWFVDESTSYCTALHIASFALWRLFGVKKPAKFEEIKRKRVATYIITMWVISIVFGGFIFSYFYDVDEKKENTVSACWPMCSIRIGDGVEQHKIYYTFSSSTFLLFPMFVLTIASILLVRELSRKRDLKSSSRKAKEKRASIQLALISTSFLIGYVPMTSYVMWTTRSHSDQSESSCAFDYWFHVAAYFCLRLSECINPLVYNAASSKMRIASKDILWRIRTCFRYQNKEIQMFVSEQKRSGKSRQSSPLYMKTSRRSDKSIQFKKFPKNMEIIHKSRL